VGTPTGIVLRPNVEAADVDALRDAYRQMQARSDNRSWIYWAEYHGFNRYDCWHYDLTGPSPGREFSYSLFLPWHRAYLHNFQHVVRDFNDDAIIPWWDWTSNDSHANGIPAAFTEAEVGGDANPLASGPRPAIGSEPAGRTRRFPGDPGRLPHQKRPTSEPQQSPLPSIQHVLALAHYDDFSSQLENVHDFIHGWVGGVDPDHPSTGGDMGVVATSAFDPLFFAHHTMIDRLWYQWQLIHGVDNIPPHYGSRNLAPWGVTVEQVLDIHALGYEYASSSASATPAPAGASSASGQ
jgi:tyrosinase